MRKQIRQSALILALCLLTVLPVSANGLEHFTRRQTMRESTFWDVSPMMWFYENVRAVYEQGLMIGKEDAFFDPDAPLTLAETVTIGARLHAIYASGVGNFESGEPWYRPYAEYALKNGVISSLTLSWSRDATRAEFARILASSLPEEALPAVNPVASDAIPDVKEEDEAGAEIYLLYRAGVLTGLDEEGTFRPNRSITRAEAAAIITRMTDVSLRKSIRLGQAESVEALSSGSESIRAEREETSEPNTPGVRAESAESKSERDKPARDDPEPDEPEPDEPGESKETTEPDEPVHDEPETREPEPDEPVPDIPEWEEPESGEPSSEPTPPVERDPFLYEGEIDF